MAGVWVRLGVRVRLGFRVRLGLRVGGVSTSATADAIDVVATGGADPG